MGGDGRAARAGRARRGPPGAARARRPGGARRRARRPPATRGRARMCCARPPRGVESRTMLAALWLLADAAEEGRKVVLSMLVVGLIFVGVIALGELTHYLTRSTRPARRAARCSGAGEPVPAAAPAHSRLTGDGEPGLRPARMDRPPRAGRRARPHLAPRSTPTSRSPRSSIASSSPAARRSCSRTRRAPGIRC